MSTQLFVNAAQVVTCESPDESTVLRDACVAVRDGKVAAVGPADELRRSVPAVDDVVDCGGGVLTPGFVDSHTHAVFGRWRSEEYALRSRGVPYMEIAQQGGGINASVADLRSRTEDELLEITRERVHTALRHGTTTMEVKSGYGLRTEDELKSLRVIRKLQQETGPDLIPTFLGAHEVPPEFRDRRERYIELVVEEMIPAVAAGKLAVFCDVFMEPGVFTGEEARRVLEAGLEHGLQAKLHADELEPSGGAELAVALRAASADHLAEVSETGIRELGRSDTVATLLPATLFFLGKTKYAPARHLIEAGATVALATDFNPGSSPSANMPLVLTIACSQMGIEPIEAIFAATVGGARALRLEDERGTLRGDAVADIVLWDAADYRDIPYRFGTNLVRGVWKRGERLV